MEKKIITSHQNKFVKHVKALQLKKNRKNYKQYIIEGLRSIEECYKYNLPIDYVLYSSEIVKLQGGKLLLEKIIKAYRCYEVSEEVFEKLSDTENPQGILAVVPIRDRNLLSIPINKESTFVILDRIQDPGNMGTIIRTAEAAGVDAVLVTKGCVDPYNPKTVRATMGALLHIPIIELNNDYKWIKYLKDNEVKLIATSLDTDNSYLDIDYRGKIAFIIGNEANGIDVEILSNADVCVKIPILGKIQSLNASIAAAILIYKGTEHKMK